MILLSEMKIVKKSTKRQCTIPKGKRGKSIKEEGDDIKWFGLLSESAFDFWNDPADDVYNKFYSEKNRIKLQQ